MGEKKYLFLRASILAEEERHGINWDIGNDEKRWAENQSRQSGARRLGDREGCVISCGVVLKRRLVGRHLQTQEEPDPAVENLQRSVSSSESWVSKPYQAGFFLP